MCAVREQQPQQGVFRMQKGKMTREEQMDGLKFLHSTREDCFALFLAMCVSSVRCACSNRDRRKLWSRKQKRVSSVYSTAQYSTARRVALTFFYENGSTSKTIKQGKRSIVTDWFHSSSFATPSSSPSLLLFLKKA